MSQASRARDGSLLVVVGARRVECGLRAGGQWVPASLLALPLELAVGRGGDAPSAAIGRLAPALASLGVRRLRVCVADTWLSVAGVPWSAAQTRPVAAETFARAQLAEAGFDVQADDLLRLDDAPYGQPRLAVAYPHALLSALDRLAGELDAVVESVLPLSVVAWHAAAGGAASGPRALGVIDDGLQLTAQGVGRLVDVVVRGRDDAAGDALRPLLAQWRRMQLRDTQLAEAEPLSVLDLASDAANAAPQPGLRWLATPAHDGSAVSPRVRWAASVLPGRSPLDARSKGAQRKILHRVAAGMSLAVAAVLGLQAWQAAAQVQQATRQLAQAHDARPAPRSAPWTREETARAQAVNAAIRQLNLPMSALLRAVQPPRDTRVALLSLELSGSNADGAGAASGVRIVAEALSGEEMARYVGVVAERKPFVGAHLTRHEVVETATGRSYRFTVEAAWQE